MNLSSDRRPPDALSEVVSVDAFASNNAPTRSASMTNKVGSWFLRVMVILVAFLGPLWNPFDKPALHLCMGIAILILGLWPIDQWLRSKHRRSVPVFELHLFFYAITFGFAAFVSPPRLTAIQLRVNEGSYSLGLAAALVGLICLYMGYGIAKHFKADWIARLAPRFPVGADSFAVIYIYPIALLLSILVEQLHASSLIQVILPLRLFAFIWVLFAAWSGVLQRRFVLLVNFVLLPIEFAIFGGLLAGNLVGILTYGELIVVCCILAKGRVPIGLVFGGVLAFIAFQPIKSAYRDVVWDRAPDLTTLERVDLLRDLTIAQAEGADQNGSVKESFEDSYLRINHLVASSAIIQEVQGGSDYWYGSTYFPLFTKWIPRALWPDKPVDEIGNSWARSYGLLGARDYVTSFNLPWLPEMFMNFGWFGIVVISGFIGFIMGALKRGIIDRVRSPVEVAFAYIVASPFFWPESNLSLQLGGVLIMWISISLLLVAIRLLLSILKRPSLRYTA